MYEKEEGEISEKIVFLALLHLCNERNLELRQTNRFSIAILHSHEQ
jgi:chromatin segregation and condensation protein Rec8/ScpA/Scc1 (kleisin family)